jgi:hypothetical protein
MKNIIIERVIRDGGNRIALRFPYDQELNSVVKELPDAQWSSDMKYWHISDSSDIVSILRNFIRTSIKCLLIRLKFSDQGQGISSRMFLVRMR